uniref:Uncharacterized protein n=1 Tax=Anguilla anguilla TaxID=7936 RepID=A0A0E9QAK1_ANGAN
MCSKYYKNPCVLNTTKIGIIMDRSRPGDFRDRN